MPEPHLGEEHTAREAFQPDRAPGVAHDRGIRRQPAQGQQHGTPGQVLVQEAAAHVVGVVRVAVVRAADGDDRAERLGPAGGDLQRVEAAPRLAHHPDHARAPWLRRDPPDDLSAVLELLLVVLVEEDTVRIARAAHVDAHGSIAVPGEVAMHRFIPGARQVPLAVRDVLEDRRHRRDLRVGWEPDAGGEPAAIGQRDPAVLDLADRAGKRGLHPHRMPPGRGGAAITPRRPPGPRVRHPAARATGTPPRAARGPGDPRRDPSS